MGRNAQSRMFLQCVEDNFLMQMVVELVRSDVPLDLVLTKKEGLSGDVKAGGSLGWSNHETAEFKILCERSKAISRIATLDFRRANFSFLKDLFGGIP